MTKRKFYKVCREMLNIVGAKNWQAESYITEVSEFFPSGVLAEGQLPQHSICQPLPTPNGNTLLLFHESILKLNKYEIFINILDSIVWVHLYGNRIYNSNTKENREKWKSLRREIFDRHSKATGLVFIFKSNVPIKVKKNDRVVWYYKKSKNKDIYKGFIEANHRNEEEINKEDNING